MIALARLVLQDPPEASQTAEYTAYLKDIQEQATRLGDPQIALIMGGATKIKQYVFESAKLPEIRGASGLLDRINLYDIPALFAKQPSWLKEFDDGKGDSPEKAEAERLVTQVRTWFQERYGVEPPDCEECIIYASGGEVLAFAPHRLAAVLTEAIEGLYTQQTLVANSVASWRACSLVELRFGLRPLQFWIDEFSALTDDTIQTLVHDYYGGSDTKAFLSRKTFGEVTSALALERLRAREGNTVQQKAPKPPPRFETTPYARRCQSCEYRSAVIEGPLGAWLCQPCARKRAFGQKAKREAPFAIQWFREGRFGWEPLAARAWGTRFAEWLDDPHQTALAQRYYQQAPPDRVQPAEDLDGIAAAAQPEGFIGVIYADGNNMGALLEGLQTPAAYHEFAYTIYRAIEAATFTALAIHLHPRQRNERWWHPFDVLSIGGDDVFLIVPAHAALPIAITIANQVEKELVQYYITQRPQSYRWQQVHRIEQPASWQAPAVQSKVSLSSGVVIADQHTPIFMLRRLVEESLKSAKSKARQLRDHAFHGATIDFIALKSIGMLATNIGDFRESALRRGSLHLTAKPYTVPELTTLIEAVRILKQKDFPKSQLYRLREQLHKGWLASTMDYLYFQARTQHAEELRHALDWTGREPHGRSGGSGMWLRRDEDEWETMLGDVVELYDFVPVGGESHGA
jgi:CRISPR-associated protein Cmr2